MQIGADAERMREDEDIIQLLIDVYACSVYFSIRLTFSFTNATTPTWAPSLSVQEG